jgi:hypothetical protein
MDILASVITAGVVTAVLTTMLALVRIALGAERRRADDWRTAAQTSAAANDVLTANMEKLITSHQELVVSTRDMMALLRTVAADRRSAA